MTLVDSKQVNKIIVSCLAGKIEGVVYRVIVGEEHLYRGKRDL